MHSIQVDRSVAKKYPWRFWRTYFHTAVGKVVLTCQLKLARPRGESCKSCWNHLCPTSLATICCCFVMAFNRCGHTFRCNVGHCWMQFGSLLDVFFEYWGPLGQLWLRSWIMLEFWLPFWCHFLDIFGFWGMLFSTVFSVCFRNLFFQVFTKQVCV